MNKTISSLKSRFLKASQDLREIALLLEENNELEQKAHLSTALNNIELQINNIMLNEHSIFSSTVKPIQSEKPTSEIKVPLLITELPFCNRTRNALSRAGIKNYEQLLKHYPNLWKIRGFGSGCYKEVDLAIELLEQTDIYEEIIRTKPEQYKR